MDSPQQAYNASTVNYQTILANQVDLYDKWVLDRMRKYFEKEYDQEHLKTLIQTQLKANSGTRKLASELGHFFKFWGTDWHWVSFHITQDYYSQRRFFERLSFIKHNASQVLVFKTLEEGSCEKSRKLYLTNPSDLKSEPKIFSLSELLQNGSNLGEEPNKIKPTLGVTDFGIYKDKDDEVHLIYDKFYLKTKDYPDDVWDYCQQKFVPNKERKEHLKNVSKYIKAGNAASTLGTNSTINVQIDAKGLKRYYLEKKKQNKQNLLSQIIKLFK